MSTTSLAGGLAPYSITTLNAITAFFMIVFHVLAVMALFQFTWTNFLVAVDVLYLVAGVWAFEPIATGE